MEKLKVELAYMSGAGNLFTVVDNRNPKIDGAFYELLAPILCGKNEYNDKMTEGLVVMNEGEDDSQFDISFYNPDGSSETMCGNGGRCAVMFAVDKKFVLNPNKNDTILFNMAGDKYQSEFKGDTIKLYFPPPKEIKTNIEVVTENGTFVGTFVNVNSEHFAINKQSSDKLKDKKLDDICIETIAPAIRFNDEFKPKGVNVNIYEMVSRNKINLRTYERGVEAETGACGTGALSTMLAALFEKDIDSPIAVVPPSKSELTVDFQGEFPNEIQSLSLEGKAVTLGEKTIEIPINIIERSV